MYILACNVFNFGDFHRTDKGDIKHMKIYQMTRDVKSQDIMYYLSSHRLFYSIEELISFYERNELNEIFRG